jgi:hypothetical protein
MNELWYAHAAIAHEAGSRTQGEVQPAATRTVPFPLLPSALSDFFNRLLNPFSLEYLTLMVLNRGSMVPYRLGDYTRF